MLRCDDATEAVEEAGCDDGVDGLVGTCTGFDEIKADDTTVALGECAEQDADLVPGEPAGNRRARGWAQ